MAMNAALQKIGNFEYVFFGHFPCGVMGDKSSLAMTTCYFGAEESNEKILLIGDSHSRQFAYGLSESGLAENYEFHSVFGGRCLPFPERVPIRNGRVDLDCVDAQRKMKEALMKDDYDIVLVGGRWSFYSPLTVSEIRWLDEISKAPVILLGPVPNPRLHRACVFKSPSCFRVGISKEDVVVDDNMVKVAGDAGVEYVSFIKAGCDSGMCPFYIENRSVYSDKNHLSMLGSTYYSEFIVKRASSILGYEVSK